MTSDMLQLLQCIRNKSKTVELSMFQVPTIPSRLNLSNIVDTYDWNYMHQRTIHNKNNSCFVSGIYYSYFCSYVISQSLWDIW